MASIRCVRPILTTWSNAFALAASARLQRLQRGDQVALERLGRRDVDGGREHVVRRLPHVDVVVGVDRLLAADASPPRIWIARFAITSLAFMLLEVPEPVWKMSTTNSSSCWPAATSCAAWMIASASLRVQLAAPRFTSRGGLLDQRQRADHAAGQAEPADREVLGRPLRLRARKARRPGLRPCRASRSRSGLRSAMSYIYVYSSNSTSSVRSSAPASSRAPDSSAVVLRSRSASTCVNAHSSLVDSCGSLRMIS